MVNFNRHDVPQTFVDVVNKAIELDIVDVADIVVLTVNFGTDFKKIVGDIVMYAYCRRHCDDTHYDIVPVADKFWMEINKKKMLDK